MRELTKPWMRLWIVCVVLLGLVAAGCGSDSDSSSSSDKSSTTSTTTAKATGNINVSDAASLTEAFEQIGTDFTKANPDATVTFNPGLVGHAGDADPAGERRSTRSRRPTRTT